MDILNISKLHTQDIAHTLLDGKTLIYPTETCYGLGCDATNIQSVEKIFQIKQRDLQKPCILLFRDIDQLKEYAYLEESIEHQISSYWPGALTVVLPVQKNTNLSPLVISKDNKIACRISAYSFLQELGVYFGKPLVSTSANMAGGENIYTSAEIIKVFSSAPQRPDIFIDAGTLVKNPPSTLIEIDRGEVKILRQGNVII